MFDTINQQTISTFNLRQALADALAPSAPARTLSAVDTEVAAV